MRVPSMFRRKSADLVADASAEVTPADEPATPAPRGYTPSKRELGKQTPKRSSVQRRRVAEKAPENRREAYRQLRDRQRAERAEATAGMKAGDERYLLPRDRGPERSLVRDVVDSRRTVGTYFFGGALVVLIGSQPMMPKVVQLGTNILWVILAAGVVIDSILIARKVKRLVRERFPKSDQRLGSLYLYGIMRGLTFRRMRIPKPKVEIGAQV
ncbi:membrane protein [Spirilliplanes yamanashiensis]|uniref:Membrane protein n=2 Tax=Spirilliplanes yamanashiensis TaxID=42233 RepID=A0A8J4DJR1_9ACTN|nr:membrane protein [Spirilliplanes yamanashiensis]